MTVTTAAAWEADGRPWKPAPCILALENLLHGKGYTVYVIGDDAHEHANPPEDHMPYSHTAWPAGQPYPYVLAMDVMPATVNGLDWRQLGAQIIADRSAGIPGTEWIKYVNWTSPTTGAVRHTSWEPDHAETSSTDGGHIHISARSDLFTQTDLKGWDPFARAMAAAGGWTIITPVSGGPTDPTEALVAQLPTLARGANSQYVANLQGLLNAHGASLKIDHDFGPLTDSALRSFQVAHHVAGSVTTGGQGDGQAGPHTWAALLDG